MGNERMKAEAIGASPPAAIAMISILVQAPSPRSKLTAATATAKKATTADRGKGKAAKKVFSLTGQKFKKPEETEPLWIFYESLSKQIPSSEMAQFWYPPHLCSAPLRQLLLGTCLIDQWID
ncbi:hypothetical protein D1007_39457 [Hordeum vulgare]|nr:hypothetical protein D1007_39457 [Hordeum vulgare]